MKSPDPVLFCGVITLVSTMVFIPTQNRFVPILAIGIIVIFLAAFSYLRALEQQRVRLVVGTEQQLRSAFRYFVLGSFSLALLGAFYATSETLRMMI